MFRSPRTMDVNVNTLPPTLAQDDCSKFNVAHTHKQADIDAELERRAVVIVRVEFRTAQILESKSILCLTEAFTKSRSIFFLFAGLCSSKVPSCCGAFIRPSTAMVAAAAAAVVANSESENRERVSVFVRVCVSVRVSVCVR